jgi:hypothetical protein
MATTTTKRVTGAATASTTKRIATTDAITETTTKRVTEAATVSSTVRVDTFDAVAASLGTDTWGRTWGGVGTKDYSWGKTWFFGVTATTAAPLLAATKRVVGAITQAITKRVTGDVS